MEFRGALFDLDGTLLDSTALWGQVDHDFLAKRNIPVPDDFMKAVSSKTFEEAARYTIDRFGLSDAVEDLSREWYGMVLDEYSHRVPLKPCAKDFLLLLRSRGLSLGVVTGLPRELADAALRHHGIESLFAAVTSAEEAERGKDFPQVYELAAEKLGLSCRECAVFEDVLACMKSARRAGAEVFALYDERTSGQHWLEIRREGFRQIRSFSELMTL